MKFKNKYSFILILLFLASCSPENTLVPDQELDKNYSSSAVNRTNNYKKNLEFVLGDVKQALIFNKLKDKKQVDALIKGFKNLGVNGVRIPIYANGKNPNSKIYNYLFSRLKANKFKIFANPAFHGGARRIANGKFKDLGTSVKGSDEKCNNVIKKMKKFSKNYKCDWISPFNEDGKPGTTWDTWQINKIFKSLKNQLNGAKLIGPCTWGIKGSIKVLEETDVLKYIDISTTHNLGFNHGKWPKFKATSKNLKVWDSETNFRKKFPNKLTRIESAMKHGVHGLVLYDSWKYINLSNGSINNKGKNVKKVYHK